MNPVAQNKRLYLSNAPEAEWEQMSDAMFRAVD